MRAVPAYKGNRGPAGLGARLRHMLTESFHSQIETSLMMWGRARVKWAPRE